jgi:DNA-binding NtrC family response regulator
MVDKIRLLIVDDEVKFLHPMAKRLELRGFDVTRATSGQEAIRHATEGQFDLVILDLKMPEVDGKQVLQFLKKQSDFIEVIVVTGHGSTEAAVECIKMGAFSYLPKPYELEKILEVLRQAYASRLKKKFHSDPVLIEKLNGLEKGLSPMEALQAMRELTE